MYKMKHGKHTNLWIELIVVVASVLALMMLLYVVMMVSFQNGAESVGITMKLAEQIADKILDNPTQEQVKAVSMMIRCVAHLVLFFVVGVVTAFVGMVIFRRYFRIIGVAAAGMVCYALAYYTEYYKQFIDGRHFHMFDVTLNWYGSLAGIGCMVLSYFVNRLLVKLSS